MTTITHETSREALIDRLAEFFYVIEDEYIMGDPRTKDDIALILESFQTSTLQLMDENTPSDYSMLLCEAVGYGRDVDEERIKYCIKLMDVFLPSVELKIVESIANGLLSHEHFKDVEALSTMEGELLESARALCKVTAHIHSTLPSENRPITIEGYGQSRHLSDETLTRFLIENPDSADEINDFISQRRAADAELVQHYLANTTPLRVGDL